MVKKEQFRKAPFGQFQIKDITVISKFAQILKDSRVILKFRANSALSIKDNTVILKSCSNSIFTVVIFHHITIYVKIKMTLWFFNEKAKLFKKAKLLFKNDHDIHND